MSRLFHRATDWIVDWPGVTFLVLLILSTITAVGNFRPDLASRLFKGHQPEESLDRSAHQEVFERPPDINPFDIGRAHAIVVVESDSLFSPDGARAIRAAVQGLKQLRYVRDVTWLESAPPLNIFGLPEPLVPNENASQMRFDNARIRALQNPLVKGQLLSGDARTLLLLVNFDFFFVEQNEDCIGTLRKAAETAAAEAANVDMEFSVTGRVPMYVSAMKQREANVVKYQLIGYSMIALMALILFRGLSAVLIVAAAPALGVFWTMGLLPYFEMSENPFNDVILPVLVSLVGMTDGVHLMVHIRKLRAAGMSTQEAARNGLHEVGLACALTSLTTAVGFGSLAFAASHEVVQEFGTCCVIGVLMTFVSVLLTIPLLCSSRLGSRVHHGLEKSLIDKNLGRISVVVDYVLQRTVLFSRMGIGLTLLLAAMSLVLRPDERRSEALPDDAEPVIALRKMDKALGGLEFGTVQVRWSKQVASDSPEVIAVLGKIDQELAKETLLGHPLSIFNLIGALPGGGSPEDRVSMLELLPPPLKRAFYTPEYRVAEVMFRVQDIGIAKYGPVFERTMARMDAIVDQHPEFEISLRGSAYRRWEDLYKIVLDLVESLVSASVIIFIVLSIVYRSLRIGLISIVPNLFPLVLSAGFLVVTGQYLEMVSVCAFTVCLGIAVDDTIHFLTRYHEERKRCEGHDEAIRRAFTGVGTALIMTTVVLLAGFATVLTSESREHRIFAWLGGITIAAALLGDLLFLPALLARYAGKSADE